MGKDFGRLLILNDMANLAENDKVEYTHTLMNLPNENYGGKEVLILGGGDGGLLKELLELPKGQVPAFITMVEIDEMVMTACSEYMPSVCGKYTRKKLGRTKLQSYQWMCHSIHEGLSG